MTKNNGIRQCNLLFKMAISTLLFNVCSSYAMDLTTAQLAKQLKTIEPPIPIKRINPKYPMEAARQGRTGWAKFSFIVEPDGSVSNILTVDSSGSKDFEQASIKALKRWKYEPAKVDGKPVQRCFNTVQLDFKILNDNSYGVRRKFKSKYSDAQQALKNNELDKVKKLIDEMSSMKNRFEAEHNFLQTIKAAYYKAKGDKIRQLKSLSNIHFSNDSKKADDHELAVLHQRFILSVELNRLKQAFHVYDKLTKLAAAEKYLSAYQETLDNVTKFVASDNEILVDTVIEEQLFWSHALVRNEFTFANINGALSKLEVRCNNKYHVFNINEQSSWRVPETWEGCSLMVYGEQNSRFTLVELANRA